MFDFEKISASKFYVAPPVERVVEFSPPGIDIDNIAKVLSLAVDARSASVVAYDGYAQVNGRTNFRLTYLDREGVARGVDYNADFSVKADGDFSASDSVSADIRIVESDAQASAGLTLSAVLEVQVSAICRRELNVLVDADGCYRTTKNIYLPSYLASKSVVLPFDAEFNAAGEITSVLSLNINSAIRRAEATEGGAVVGATLFATVTYVQGGEIRRKDFDIELEDEVGLDGVIASDNIRVDASVKASKIVLQGVTDDNTIRLEGELQLRIQAFRCAEVSVVDDMFYLTNEVNIARESQNYVCFDGCGFFSEKVSGTATLGDNRAAAVAINALPYAGCYTSKAYADENGKLTVEGVVNTDVIYSDENGYNSVRTEVPFALSIDSEKPFSENVCVKCTVIAISATIRRDREIDMDLTLAVEVCGYSDVTADFISNVEIGDEKPHNTSAISLYIARGGDQLLDLCKALTAMPEDIVEQNPTLTFPLSEGERVVYFRRIAV